VDNEAYDKFLEAIDPPMVVVTAVAGPRRGGCLIGFNVPCSINPPLYAAWLSHRNHTYDVARAAEVLTVHTLTPAELSLAEHFGSLSGHDVDKFAGVRSHLNDQGGLVVDVEGGWFTGRIVDRLESGDHTLFLLDPVAAGGRAETATLRLHDVRHLEPGRPA
jgi:flavin reductase (DIM6/NTAB) family NADH-FMN oxidoreductase RutF